MCCRTVFVLAALSIVLCPGCGGGFGGGGEAKPRARLIGIHFGRLDRAALELVFDVKIANRYSTEMPLTNMTYSLSSKSTELVTGSAKPNTTIAVGAKQKVALPVRVHYGRILRTLKDVEPGSRIPYSAKLVLSVDAGGAGELEVPLRKKGKVTLPFVSRVTYKRILELVEYK
ncbi:MAG: LEA type 2 family protein [Sedimentisphaerales bacterium]|nr:LEA type 2 family protein [Sedimentisphaerales bacterium]